MNIDNLNLMSTMLTEVATGNWKGIAPDTLINLGPFHLIDVRVKDFDLNNWVERTSNCGFSACAVGHAMYDPRFNALGLQPNGTSPMFIGDDVYRHWDAVEQFFGIKPETAYGLFRDSYYRPGSVLQTERVTDPLLVKERIIELLLNGEEAFNEKYKDLEAE